MLKVPDTKYKKGDKVYFFDSKNDQIISDIVSTVSQEITNGKLGELEYGLRGSSGVFKEKDLYSEAAPLITKLVADYKQELADTLLDMELQHIKGAREIQAYEWVPMEDGRGERLVPTKEYIEYQREQQGTKA